MEIYSEFQRIDPYGGVVAPDRGLGSREILSPAVARNAFASFHVAVSVPPGENYLLYVATNPVNMCRVSLYREHFISTRYGWIPDRLAEVHRLPEFGAMPDPDENIEGQNTRLYLLDLWVPANTQVARFRIEVQLKVGDWTVRPMEVRVIPAVVPVVARKAGTATLPGPEQGADAAALGAVMAALADGPQASGAEPATVREIVRRNALQDMALVASTGALTTRVLDLLRVNTSFWPRPLGAEWYLWIRDWLYGQR